MFRTHMNVELRISKVGSIKYLFKIVCKDSDRVTVEIVGASKTRSEETTGKESRLLMKCGITKMRAIFLLQKQHGDYFPSPW